MAGTTTDQAVWVQRVLGIALPGAGTTGPSSGAAPRKAWQDARQAWQDANDAVNDQINGLRTALRNRAKNDDGEIEDLVEALTGIAENGLTIIPDMNRVRLMAAIMEIGTGEPAAMQKSGAKALTLINAFDAFLASDEKIEVCDGNPFNAPVAIRATLTPPLRAMAAALQAGLARS